MADEVKTLAESVKSLKKEMKSAPADIKQQFEGFMEVSHHCERVL